MVAGSASPQWTASCGATAAAEGSAVLVVHDEDGVLRLYRRVLAQPGYEVITASDGAEAVEVYPQRQRDIGAVLLDLTMPVMNGEETHRALREVDPDVRVVLVSGYDEADATSPFAHGDLCGFLHEPFDADTLLAALERALGKSVSRSPRSSRRAR